jgi:hypothetical protein
MILVTMSDKINQIEQKNGGLETDWLTDWCSLCTTADQQRQNLAYLDGNICPIDLSQGFDVSIIQESTPALWMSEVRFPYAKIKQI